MQRKEARRRKAVAERAAKRLAAKPMATTIETTMNVPPIVARTIQTRAFKFTAPVQIAAASPDGSKRRTFRMIANTGEPMLIDPYPHPVVIDLASVQQDSQRIPALYNHQADEGNIVGQVEAFTVQDGALVAAGYFTPTADPADAAKRVLARADAGYQWQVSVGGDPATLEEVRPGETGQANGRTYAGPCYIARGTTLRELSFVVLGGDRRTSSVVARKKGAAMKVKIKAEGMTFEQWAVGFMTVEEFGALDETAKGVLQKAFDSMGMGGTPEDPAAEEVPVNSATDPEEEDKIEAETEGDYDYMGSTIGSTGVGWYVTTPDGVTDGPFSKSECERIAEEWANANASATPPTNANAKRPHLAAHHKGTSMKAQRQREAAETARVNTIKRLCAAADNPVWKAGEKEVDLAAHAIEQGWSAEKTGDKLELIRVRADRAQPPVGSGPHFIMSRDTSAEALEAAVMLRAGARLDHTYRRVSATHALKMPAWIRASVNDANRNRIMDQAHKFATYSMVDLARECCRLDGHSVPDDRNELFAQALRPSLRAASSGSTLTRIFTTSVNAMLLASYEEADDTTAGWVSETDVQNYQSQERARIDVGGGLKKRPRGKTAEHADYTDSYETYKIADYAKLFEIDDQDFIDDNLGGLKTVPTDMGQAAARLRPDLVYAIILDNPTLTATSRDLFNTTDGNLASSGVALSMVTLKQAVQAMELFRENSVNLNLHPTHLLVSPENKLLARELTQSVQIVYGADDETVRGNMNAMSAENIMPVSEARLSNGVVDPSTGDSQSGSATAFYLACANAHTIEVGYLAGTGRGPRVRSYVLDRGRYGMGWDVQMSIGAKALDWKGLFKNAGA